MRIISDELAKSGTLQVMDTETNSVVTVIGASGALRHRNRMYTVRTSDGSPQERSGAQLKRLNPNGTVSTEAE